MNRNIILNIAFMTGLIGGAFAFAEVRQSDACDSDMIDAYIAKKNAFIKMMKLNA